MVASLLVWLKGSQVFSSVNLVVWTLVMSSFIANPTWPDRVFSPRIQDKVSSFSLSNKSKPCHTHTKKISGIFSLPEIEKIEGYLFRHLLLYIRYHIPISQYRDVEFVIFFFLLYLQTNKRACHGFLDDGRGHETRDRYKMWFVTRNKPQY